MTKVKRYKWVAAIIMVAVLIFSAANTGALSLTSIVPERGPVAGGTNVTIYGNFEPLDTGMVDRISAGGHHNCAVGVDDRVYCWGDNTHGQLGVGSTQGSPVPLKVGAGSVMEDVDIMHVVSGGYFTCALDFNGKAYCWGYNLFGQLGDGSGVNSSIPLAVDMSGALAGKKIASMAASFMNACAVDTEGKAYCWGHGDNGAIGDNTYSNRFTPTKVDDSGVLSGKKLVKISTGGNHTCALDVDGAAYCWGQNGLRQLGDGTSIARGAPVAMSMTGALAGKTLADVAMGDSYSCVLDTDGKIYCWGDNWSGMTGVGHTSGVNDPTEVDTTGGISDKVFVKLAPGYMHTCAIDSTGAVYCWGRNMNGQIGDDATGTRLYPSAVYTDGVLAGKKLVGVSAGEISTCALDSTNRVYCWGGDWAGQLGVNGGSDRFTPQRVHTVLDTGDVPKVSEMPESVTPLPVKVVFDKDEIPAECVNVVVAADYKSLTCTTSAHPAGWVDVTASNSMTSLTMESWYEYYDNTTSDDEIIPPGVPNTGSMSQSTERLGLIICSIMGVLITAVGSMIWQRKSRI